VCRRHARTPTTETATATTIAARHSPTPMTSRIRRAATGRSAAMAVATRVNPVLRIAAPAATAGATPVESCEVDCAYCGDGTCNSWEDASCSDCAYCGDGVCGPGETAGAGTATTATAATEPATPAKTAGAGTATTATAATEPATPAKTAGAETATRPGAVADATDGVARMTSAACATGGAQRTSAETTRARVIRTRVANTRP